MKSDKKGDGQLQQGSTKKKVNQYMISFCALQYYGKSFHGEMRLGFHIKTNKIYIFRISPLPLSSNISAFIILQKQYSQLKQYARTIYQPVQSASNYYSALQYFPKTFQSEIVNFRQNPKYLDEYVQKFLKTYAFFYNMRVFHGNLIGNNIGITFDGRVKFMDFDHSSQDFQKGIQKDFQSFKLFISKVLQKDQFYPLKFNCFNKSQTQKWENLFGLWHVTSPLEPMYFSRAHFVQNIVTVLSKLQISLYELLQGKNPPTYDHYLQFKLSIRLLQLKYLQRDIIFSKQYIEEHLQNYEIQKKKLSQEKDRLQQIIGKIQQHDLDYYNGVLLGIIKDWEFYGIDQSRRLLLIACLIPNLNHQYIYYDIVHQFSLEADTSLHLLLGNSLLQQYRQEIMNNLLAT